MKLILREDGVEIEIKEISTIGKDSKMLFFFLDVRLKPTDIEKMEEELSKKIGVKCVVLDSLFRTEIRGC